METEPKPFRVRMTMLRDLLVIELRLLHGQRGRMQDIKALRGALFELLEGLDSLEAAMTPTSQRKRRKKVSYGEN